MKNIFLETRPQFLILSVMLVLQGGAIAAWRGAFNWVHFLVIMIGVILAHAAVNTLNDFFDARSGIDDETERTPFSGGSGMIQTGALSQKQVLVLGFVALLLAFLAGLWLCTIVGWHLMGYILVGGFSVVFYNTILSRLMLGEIFAGAGLGSLVILGTVAALQVPVDWHIVLISLPAGILTLNLLLLNEVPDHKADLKGNRRHWVIVFGPRAAIWIYTIFTILTFLLIIAMPVMGIAPWWILISGLGMVPALKAIKTAHAAQDNVPRLIPALGANVQMILGTDLLLALGFSLAVWIA